MKEVKKGIYRHFKGQMYEVIGVAMHSETKEEMVIYRALYGEKIIWARQISMWNKPVMCDGKEKARFELVSELQKTHFDS